MPLKYDPLARIGNAVNAQGVNNEWITEADLAVVGPSLARAWADDLAARMPSIRELRRRLLAIADGAEVGEPCQVCGAPMAGRSDRAYCSPACRQRAYRRRSGRLVAP